MKKQLKNIKTLALVLSPAIIYVIIQFVSQYLFFVGINIYETFNNSGENKFMEIAERSICILNRNIMIPTIIAAIITYLVLVRKNKSISLKKMLKKLNHKDYLLLIIIGMATILTGNIFSDLITGNNQQIVETSMSMSRIPLELIGTATFIPAIEEIVFRGLIYENMKKKFKIQYALFGSAVAFGIFHFDLRQCLNAMVLGIVSVVIYETFGNLKASIIVHSSANVTSLILNYICSVNGSVKELIFSDLGQIIIMGASTMTLVLLIARTVKIKGVTGIIKLFN